MPKNNEKSSFSLISEVQNNEDIESFTKDWNSGMNLVDLAKKYNFSYPGKAKTIALKLGLPLKNRQKIISNIDIESFTKDWNSGMSFVDLAVKYNLDYAEKAKRIGIKLGLKKQKNPDFFERFLSDKQKTNDFILMYNDNAIKVREITKHFGFTDNGYVSKLAKKIGIPIRVGGQGYIEKFEESRNEFTKMWNDGVLKEIIEKKFNISSLTIHSWRVRLGLEPRIGGRRFSDSITNKIELLLLENSGALTSKELKNLLNKDTLNLTDAYKSMKFQRLPLTLHMTGRRARQPTDYFGDNTGNTIIFLHGMYDSLILKLSKILKEGDMYKHNLLKKSVYKFMISRLAENEKEIKNRSSQLFQILYDKGKQNELESFIAAQLNEYSIKQKPQKSISEIKLKNSLTTQIIEGKPKSIFYGRKFQPEMILNELNSSYPDKQKNLIQEIFTPYNFICKSSHDDYFDLELISNEPFLVKLMINQQITPTTLKIFQNKLQEKRGIIINFESIPESILETTSNKISIFQKTDIFLLLTSIDFLPITPNSFAKIMFGENKEEIVFCDDVDLESNIATVSDSNKKIDTVSIKFLKNIPLPADITPSDFFNFIEKFKMISSLENISTIGDCKVNNIIFKETSKFISISSQVDSNFIKMSIPHILFDEHIEKDNYITSVGFLRNKLIKCDCLAWISQQDIILCKHSIALLFDIWKQNVEKTNKNYDRKSLDLFLDYLNFLINYSIKIENFWYDKIDNAKTNHNLIHNAICNLIDAKIFKTNSNYEEPEKSKLQHLMSQYKNENNNLFETMSKLSVDQRKMIQQSLNYQLIEKLKEVKKSL